MDCARCGEANRDGARFCSGCGTTLAPRCANCQAELRPTAKFCDECGTPVGTTGGNAAATPAPPSGPATTATRKIVTALFADLVGSTSFGERADAEVARSVMARYHSLLQGAVDAHGGTVAKFMGDGMMATFGIPQIAEDDALRAVRAGIDIQRRFTEFATHVLTQHGETLGLRVGVNTGEVVIASGDADLVGDALNVAARIEHACRPGQVTVGEETWRLTRGEFAYETLGDVTVAGRTQPVAIFEVAADTATTVVEMAAPFVGRTPEMHRLRAVLGAAIEARAARLVTVLGSPGVGKTRLSRELCIATEADDGAVTFEIRCDRAGDSTFAPIAQLIRDATDLGDDTDAASARERLGALLADDEADRERLVDILGGLVGAAPSRSVEETFWAVRRLVSATAADRPMVVVIDDIQWAEPLLLDLLEHLAEWVQDVPLLLLCLARPELREVRPSLAERNRRVEDVLALDGLDSAATEALAAGLLGTDHLPAGLVERLPTSTDGNPLFVRELVRMLVDDQVIRRNGDQWELAIDAEAVEVPPTIQSLLAARVERLPGDERAVLELAAVIGSEFNLGALRELAGADTPLPSLLESMRRKELVEPTGAYWGDEPVHRFHHVLIRDATYRRLLKTTRADLHEKVAVWTDAAAAGLIGEHEAVIAFHYEQAFRYRTELGSVDDHVTGLGRRAAELLSTASDRALGQDDLASAGALARRALALLPDTDAVARAELLTTACECTLASGDVAGARPVIEQLRAEAGDDPTLGAWASCFEAQLVGLTDPEGLVGAEATATGAAKVMEELGDGAGEAKAHQVRAGLLARLGRVGDAELELDLALGAARRVDDRRRVTAVLGAAPLAALWGPSPVARAGGRCLDVVRLLRITTASPSVEATSMRCQAVLEALRGRFDVARSMLDSSRATLEELGLRHGLLETAYLTGVVELVAGDPAAAIGPLRDAYDGLIEMGVGIDAGRAAALLAHALVAEGRVDDAEPMAAASEELAGQDLKTAIAWRVARAEVLAARGDVAGGIALAKEAVEIAAATDLVIDHADACVALAALHVAAGDVNAGRSVRAEAKRLYDLKGATVPAERLADQAVVAPAPAPTPARSPASSVHDDADERHPRAENDAATLLAKAWDLIVTDRVDEIGLMCADDAVVIDGQRIVGEDLVGRDAIVANARAVAALGADAARVEPLAVRGSRHALCRTTVSFGGFENVFLSVGELDSQGRARCIVTFNEEDLVDAINELAARYLAGEGAGSGASLATADRVISTVNRREWSDCVDLYSPDVRHVDHRRIGLPVLDREGLVGTIREYCELAPNLILCPRKLLAKGHVYLATTDILGSTPDGSAVEWVQHALGVLDATGRISNLEMYDEDDFAAALARFDELGAAEPVDPRHPRAENAASRIACSYCDAWAPDRVDELLRRFMARDVARVDHRAVVGAPDAVGHEAFAESVRSLAAVGYTATSFEPIAVRGDRLCLGAHTYRNDEGFATSYLALVQIDAADRMNFVGNYDETDLDTAIGELDARFLAGEGAPHARLLHALLTAGHADDSRLEQSFAPDLVTVDHQRIGFGTGDLEALREWRSSDHDVVRTVVEFARTGFAAGNALLVVLESKRVDERGSEFDWVSCIVIHVDASDRVDRIEWFDLEDWPAALARLDQLGAADPVDPRHPRAENTATRTRGRVLERLNAGRFEEVGGLLTEDFERVDHRTVVSMPTARGRDAFVESSRATYDAGFTQITYEPIAVRGDRLELSRVHMRAADGHEIAFLNVGEVHEAGRACSTTSFDEDALDDAVAELDARYVTGEGEPHAPMLDAGIRTLAALQAEEWTTLTTLLTDDFTFVDHRQLSNPSLDREGYVAVQQMFAEQIQRRMLVRTLHPVEHALLSTFDVTGTDAGGGAFEWGFHLVSTFDAEHRIAGSELFDEGDFPAALARLDELAVQSADPVEPLDARLENSATRTRGRALELFNLGRFAEAETRLSKDFERVDRRTVVSMPTTRGLVDFVEASRASLDAGFTHQSSVPVAIRGDRLELSRVTMRSLDGNELVFLSLDEVDAAGQICSTTSFDEDALGVAIAELDARYLAGEGAEHAAVVRPSMDHVAAINRRDWVALVATMRPDIVVGDHRGLWPATSDRDAYLARIRSLAETSPDSVVVSRRFLVAGSASLATYGARGTSEHGEHFEYDFHVPALVADGTFVGFEFFADDDYTGALARFDELATTSPTDPPHPLAENTLTHKVDRFFDSAVAGRFDDAAAHLAPNLVRVDHRTSVSDATTHGRDDYLTALRSAFDVGFTGVTIDHLAVRGERLNLMRTTFATEDGLQLPILSVCDAAADGLVSHLSLYDNEALDDAIADLEARYIAGEGAPYASRLEVGVRFVAAANAEDWATLSSLLADDFAFVDMRQLGWPHLNREQWIAAQRSYTDTITQHILVRCLHLRGRAGLSTLHNTGRDADGGEFEWVFHTITTIDAAGLLNRFEYFAEEDFAAALARLDELGTDAPGGARLPLVENTATHWTRRLNQLLNGGNPDEVAEMYAVDVVAIDRRTTVSLPTLRGRTAMRDNVQALRDVGFDRVRSEVLAVRGDHLVLQRVVFSTADGREMTTLGLNEWNDGEVVRRVVFDEEDLPEALVELDGRYAAGEGSEHADVIRVLSDGYAAMNRRDLDAWTSIHSPDHRSHDHSPIGFGELGTQRYAEYLRAGFEQVPDFVIVPATLAVDGRVALISIPVRGATPGGVEFESDLVVVTRFDEDVRIIEDHFFAPEQSHEAHALFERLAAQPDRSSPPLLQNTLTIGLLDLLARRQRGDPIDPDNVADDVVVIDRRAGVSAGTLTGREEFLTNALSHFDVFEGVVPIVVAVRGERLALVRMEFLADGFVSARLSLFEINESAQLVALVVFDEEDFAAAIDELETRNRVSEGAEHAEMLDWIAEVSRAMRTREPGAEAVRALMAPDFALVDHRTLGYGEIDLPTLTTLQDARDEQVTDDRKFHRTREIKGDAVLAWYETHASAPDGGRYTWSHWVVWQRADGLWARLEMFDLDDEAAARARFEELAATDRPPAHELRFDQLATHDGDAPEPENRITRRLRRWLLRTEHGAPTSSATIAENVVVLDRRSGVSAGTITGRADFAANARAHFDVFADARVTVLAVRGDRLALVRMEYRADGFVSPRLNLFEADESGQIVALVVLDEDDLDAAVEELDARHAVMESAGENRATFAGRRSIDAFVRGDRDAAIDAFAPEFTRADQRRGPTIGDDVGREEYVDATLAGAEVGMAHFELTPIELAGDDLALATLRWHNGDGFELEWLLVTEVDADGRILRLMNFDVDERDAASAALREWAADAPHASARMLEASSVRMDALARGDRDAVLATYTADFVREDRRRGVNFGTSTREETVDALLAGNDVGLGNRTFTTVEAVGDHFALGEFRMSHDDGFELVYLLAVEQDDEGRLRRATNFDLEDREIASSLLRQWAAERG